MFIRTLEKEDIYPALKVAWYTFSKQVAGRVGEQETERFAGETTYDKILQQMQNKELLLFGSFTEENELIGMIAFDSAREIRLFFVKPEEQHRGNGRMLYQSVYNYYARTYGTGKLKIKCLPDHAYIIEKLGFKPVIDMEQGPYQYYEIYVIHGLVMPVENKKKRIPQMAVYIGSGALLVFLVIAVIFMGLRVYHSFSSHIGTKQEEQNPGNTDPGTNPGTGPDSGEYVIPYGGDEGNDNGDQDDPYGDNGIYSPYGEYGDSGEQEEQESGIDAIKAYIADDLTYETAEDEYSHSSDQSDDITVYLDVKYPVLKGMKDSSLQKKINKKIKETALTTVDEIYTNPSDELKERVIEASTPVLADYGVYKISYATEDLLCVILQDQSYQGDTDHSATHLRTLCFNLNDGSVYELKDIINIDDAFVTAWLSSMRGEVNSDDQESFLSELTNEQMKSALEGTSIDGNYIVEYFIDQDGLEIGFDLNYEAEDSNDKGYGWVTGPFSFDEIKKYEKSSEFWAK